MMTRLMQQRMEEALNDILGDEVILKLHDGPPGENCDRNLIGGTGVPARYSFDAPLGPVFHLPLRPPVRVPLPRPWWQPYRRYRFEPATLWVRAVSVWSAKGQPLFLANIHSPALPYKAKAGERLQFHAMGRPAIHAQPVEYPIPAKGA